MTTEWKDITDPEELFRLKREGWEIEVQIDEVPHWAGWTGLAWMNYMKYRARPRQPKMKKVKLLAYIHETGLTYHRGDAPTSVIPKRWIRQPHLDLEVEVPE